MTAPICTTKSATQVFETDWLGSNPVFYNEHTGGVSHNINDVIDFGNLQFHPDGFNNFLRFGYSVFQQTPVQHVKFLRPLTRLIVQPGGPCGLAPLEGEVADRLGGQSNERDVLAALEAAIHTWENQADREIIIPTSGGYDSRLLNLLIGDKRRIRSYSFGLSHRQAQSHEVVYARALSQRLGTHWRQIPLGNLHQDLDPWDDLFGISTHAHGMYQLEFYRHIAALHPAGAPLLSGMIGDAWAGGVEVPPVHSPEDVIHLGWTHGMHADPGMSLLHGDGTLAEQYFELRRERLADARFRVLEAMRFKMPLLSYLLRVPAHFGFRPWSPFLERDIALAMLNLPAQRRTGRRWQRELFTRHGLDFEAQPLRVDRRNTLNAQALRRVPPPPLDERLLREVIRPDYVRWINRTIEYCGPVWNLFWRLAMHRRLGRPLRRRGFRDRRMEAYFAYLTLRPIERVLQRRDRGGTA
jgi:asparagine synthetase B (glutamine-hydrolysing)